MSTEPKPPPPVAPRPGALPGLYPEPSPALKNVLGLRAESDIPENWLEALGELARQVQERKNNKVPMGEWLPVYERARDIVAGIQSDLDHRITTAQTRVPSNEEIAKIQQNLVADPRKEADAVRNRVRNECKRLADEWKSRVQRQLNDHIREPALQSCVSGLELQTTPGKGEVTLQLSAAWLGRFSEYLRVTCASWGEQVCADLERDLGTAVSETAHLTLTGRRGVSTPRHTSAPEPEIRVYGNPDAKSVPVPTQLEQLFKSLRSGMMLARFIGGLVVTLGGGGVALAAIVGTEDNHTKELLGLVGAALVLLVTPLVLWSAWSEARKEMVHVQTRETTAYRTSLERWIKESLDRVLERHRERLQRHILARVGDWETALDLWWEEAVVPALRQQELAAQQKTEEMKETAARLGVELNSLRTLRNSIATQLKSVKVRHQEIMDEA